MISRTLFSLTLATLSAAAPARGQLPELPVLDLHRLWPGDLGRVGLFGRVIAARITGHNAPDIVILDGNKPRLVTAPGIHQAVGPLPWDNPSTSISTNDLTTLVGRGSPAGQDALALVGPLGLRIWRHDLAGEFATISPVTNPAWHNAQAVAAHPLDSSVIFGINSLGSTVLSVVDVDGTWQPGASIVAASPILAIACVDWDGHVNGQTEVAVLTSDSLAVYSRTGSVLRTVAPLPSVTSGAITRVRATNHAGEWIACVTPKPAGGSLLRVIAHDIASPQLVDLGATQFVAVTAGDATIDGRDDLVLSSEDSDAATILFNGYTGPSSGNVFAMQANTGLRVPLGGSGVNAANALVLDIDNDGDGDFFAPVEAQGGPGSLLAARSTLYLPGITLVPPTITEGTPSTSISLPFHQLPSQATHTDFVLWQVDLRGTMTPRAIHTELIPAGRREVEILVDSQFLSQGGSYAFILRPVIVEDEGSPVFAETGPAFLGRISTHPLDGGIEVGGVGRQPALPPAPPSPPPATNPG